MDQITRQQIERRRTFAIISHPDAGKTTLTEKLLLYGGAIQSAGSVKGKHGDKHATSDWMELEKQRGISVTSSVMQFEYEGYCINILDTPGHQDFSEDTYRTLMAADSAVMVIDAAKGIEPQTRKLFKVCAMRGIPIFTFINKLDREARDPFELLDELETEFGIGTYPMNWPISCGATFQGIYDRGSRKVLTYDDFHAGRSRLESVAIDLSDRAALEERIPAHYLEVLEEQAELLDGAGEDFDLERVHRGKLSPVFFGSALNNFGVEQFLESFLRLTTGPLPRRNAEGGTVAPLDGHFSAFVFKIQANMNKAHRDRISFLRICSGKFLRGSEYYHLQGGRTLRLSRPQQMMAQERDVIDEAYAGDIIGVFDPGVFSIGDTVCEAGQNVRFAGIPTFAPEHFAVIEQVDSMKRKQFAKGMTELAQEGAIQIFFYPGSGMERVVVGVVGVLQFDVLKFRMQSEYGVEYLRRDIAHELIRRVQNPEFSAEDFDLTSDTMWVKDVRGGDLLIFNGAWALRWAREKNPGLLLAEFYQDIPEG
ncbi:MAG: peptide chain release factor 3 [Oscillospiraceae bacterium]|nr:peptide chain release factor 3 [Oscillospiraceae bacterium]MBR4691704.1 peptide chain release factor 3 [Oscillospiraceae bacterium]